MQVKIQPVDIPDHDTMPEKIDLEQLVTVYAAAKELGLGTSSISRYCQNYRTNIGAVRIPHILVGEGRVPMIPREALEAFRSSYKKGVMKGKRLPLDTEVAVPI